MAEGNAELARSVQFSADDSTQLRKADLHDSIYHARQRPRNLSATRDDHARQSFMSTDDEDPGLIKPGDFKQKQVFTGKLLLWLAYQSIGVIYGDIGTSPLYVYSSTFTSPPSHQDLVGVLSLIIWSLMMMVTIKYVFIVLRADNNGEGGTFSTYSLLSRYLNITNRDPNQVSLIEMKRYASGDLEGTRRRLRSGIESSKFVRGLLKVVGLLSVTMIIADGVLTPAQSVLGAVQGLQVVSPGISRATVVGATDAILVALFLIQPFGITKITVVFSPIVLVWLAFNAVFGIYNLAHYDASVLKAFSPSYAFEFLIRNKETGWRMLGGVLLAFTGLEALFADLGAFSRRAVQLSWLCYTFPCLLLGYIGQAAYISHLPEAYDNPFFNTVPPGTLWPALIVAILAAIVASQAIITATFQLISFMIKLSYFPRIKVYHTSEIFHGQLYIPLANWLLMIGTVLVATLYKNTTALGQAYGICVMFVTFFDTCMVSMVAIFVWRFHPLMVVLPWLTIACLDGTFISSALIKVPNGGWFTLTLATILALMLLLWRYGKESQWRAESTDRFPTTHFVRACKNGELVLTESYGGAKVTPFQGFGIFFDKLGERSPLVFSHFVQKLTAIPQVAVFFHLRAIDVPSVPLAQQFTVSRLALPGYYRLVVRHGYNDKIMSQNLSAVIYEQIHRYVAQYPNVKIPNEGESGTDTDYEMKGAQGVEGLEDTKSEKQESQIHRTVESPMDGEIEALEKAYKHKVLFILGKEELKIQKPTSKFSPAQMFRGLVLAIFIFVRDNTSSRMSTLNVPIDDVIQVGFLKDL